MTTRTESITAPDGLTFDGYTVLPASGAGPGVLVMQEIFGVNEYIRDVCHRLAALGYVAMAPDVYWRIERNVDIGIAKPWLIWPRSLIVLTRHRCPSMKAKARTSWGTTESISK